MASVAVIWQADGSDGAVADTATSEDVCVTLHIQNSNGHYLWDCWTWPETTRLGSTGTTGIAGLGSAGLWAWDQPPLPGE